MVYTTQPGHYHDFAKCYWYFYDSNGKLVATISDEAYARAGVGMRGVLLGVIS